jgi:uncharacterized membrane protein YphA (DoxX/SURF4 family)
VAVSKRWSNPLVILQLLTGVYLLSLGLSELVTYSSEVNQFARSVSRAFGGSGSVLPVIVAILEIAAGVLLIWGLFGSVSGRLLYLATMAIAALWVVRVLVAFVFNEPLEPRFLTWLTRVTGELIPGIVVWTVGRQYS